MPTTDVTIFNASADEPGGEDLIVQIPGAEMGMAASAVSAQQSSNNVNVPVVGAGVEFRSGSISTVTGSDEQITENSDSYFVDFTNGNDSWDGLYATDQGDATGGPFKTLSAVTPLALAGKSIWILQGGTSTLKNDGRFWNQTDWKGTSNNYVVLGAYYLDGVVPKRGLGGGARPILQGTVARLQNYDGSAQISTGDMYPSAAGTGDVGAGSALVGYDQVTDTDVFCRVENLYVRHSGGRGIRFDNCGFVEVHNCYTQLCMDAGIHMHYCYDFSITNCYISGCGSGRVWRSATTHPVILKMLGPRRGRISGCRVWQNWGEHIGVFQGGTDNLFEDNVSFDSWRIHFYIDTNRRSVYRRNLCFQTGRGQQTNKCSGLNQSPAFSHQLGETFQFPPQTQADKTANGAVHSNIGIGCRAMHESWDQQGRQVGPPGNLESYYVFRNTDIDCGNTHDLFNDDYTTDDGRYWDNMHLTYDNPLSGSFYDWDNWNGTWDYRGNGWLNGRSGVPSLNGNVVGAIWTGDQSGWTTLWAETNWQFDDHVLIDDVEVLISRVKGKLGTASILAEDSGTPNSSLNYPAEVTISSYDGLDFFGNPYTQDTIGAIRA